MHGLGLRYDVWLIVVCHGISSRYSVAGFMDKADAFEACTSRMQKEQAKALQAMEHREAGYAVVQLEQAAKELESSNESLAKEKKKRKEAVLAEAIAQKRFKSHTCQFLTLDIHISMLHFRAARQPDTPNTWS